MVLDDADIELAMDQVMLGAFRSAGQKKCTATSRLIVTEGIADQFLTELATRVDALVVGDPTDEATQMGPVITGAAQRNIYGDLGTAMAQDAEVLAGGEPYFKGLLAEGFFFVAPTLVELTAPADIWSEELFGPVLTARRATDADEAFALANDSEFGLSAAVFTQDLTRALHAVEHIDVGGVLHINSESAGADPHVPFGGGEEERTRPQRAGHRSARVLHPHHHRVSALRSHSPANSRASVLTHAQCPTARR